MEYIHVTHTFGPVFDGNSKILILGSVPSVKSREQNFYYGHPQNRFWRVLSGVTGDTLPETIELKKEFLLRNHIALWDVIESCDISGSSDSSIKNAAVNDISIIINNSSISAVFANGEKAFRLFNQKCQKNISINIVKLPSTSPANAAYSLNRLIEVWGSKIDGLL